MDVQTGIALLIVAGCVAYVARTVWRRWSGEAGVGCGCAECPTRLPDGKPQPRDAHPGEFDV